MPGRPPTPSEAISPGGLLDIPNALRASWDIWRIVLRAAWAKTLTAEQAVAFREVAGEHDPPTHPVKELWACVGRSGGKDSVASAIAVTAALKGFTTRRPGEKTLIACVAVDRVQAEIVFGYIARIFRMFQR